jgi:hypothetical protein
MPNAAPAGRPNGNLLPMLPTPAAAMERSGARLASLALLSCLALPLGAAVQWQHIADYTDAAALCAVDGMLFGASNRGGFAYGPGEDHWQHFSITDHMVSLDQVAVTGDGQGWVFWAGADGSISGCAADGSRWSGGFLEFREHPQIISVLHLSGRDGRVIACHQNGLTLFRHEEDRDEYLVESNVRQFGSLPAGTVPYAALGDGSSLHVVTGAGFASAPGWPGTTGPFVTQDLPSGLGPLARAWLVDSGDDLWAFLTDSQGESRRLRRVGDAWVEQSRPEGTVLSASGGDGLLAWSESGGRLHFLKDGIHQFRTETQACRAVAVSDGVAWYSLAPGQSPGRLRRLDPAQPDAVLYSAPDVPGAESFVDLDLDAQGRLWLAGVAEDAARNGLYTLTDQGWASHRFGYPRLGEYPTSLACDREGGVWVGTWGRGLLYFNEGQDTLNLRNGSDPEQRVYGFESTSPDFELVSDITQDSQGNLWFVNHRAWVDSFLVVIPNAWHQDRTTGFHRAYYSRHVAGDRDSYPWHVCAPEPREIWLGVGGKETGDTDKTVVQYRPSGSSALAGLRTWRESIVTLSDARYNFGYADGEASGLVTGLAADRDGTVWASTENGIFYSSQFGSNPESFSRIQFVPGLNSEIASTIATDVRGRVWIASDRGLNVYDPLAIAFDEPAWVQELNRLVSAQQDLTINRILADGDTGWVLLATNMGLFRALTPLMDHGNAPAGTTVLYPNPFRPEQDGRVSILSSSLANSSDTRVSIFDLGGRLLRRLDLAEAEEGWDGRDQQGQAVPTGVYLVLVSSSTGSGSGKLAVIRD